MATHFYHYNVNAEQRFFLGKERELFELIALNGNIVSHTPAGVAGFVATTGKPFYIDPQTHAFQHSTQSLKRDVSNKQIGEPPRYEFKPSISKMASKFLESPFARVIERDEPLTPKDFLDEYGSPKENVVTQVCKNVVAFQKSTLLNSLKKSDREFMEDDSEFEPHFVIAPYFYIGSKDADEWLLVNEACYTETRSIEPDVDVYYEMVVSKPFLRYALDKLLQSLEGLKPRGILLWIDDFMEETLSQDDIKMYVNLLRSLRSVTDTVLNIHGGYLSILLTHEDFGGILNGVGHSINYGESRHVVPVGGGLPMARFYFRPVHSRLRYGDAISVMKDMNWLSSSHVYSEKVCSCKQCRELSKKYPSIDSVLEVYGESFEKKIVRRDGREFTREYPTADAKRVASNHYLYNKAQEFKDISTKSIHPLLDELHATFKEISAACGYEHVGHLGTWHEALSELLG